MSDFKYVNEFNCRGWNHLRLQGVLELIKMQLGEPNPDTWKFEVFGNGVIKVYTKDQSWQVSARLSGDERIFQFFVKEYEIA